jgi:hypothetical protein
MPRELKIKNRSEFLRYLDSVSKINDSAIFDIRVDGISCLVSSIDNTLVLLSELKGEFDFSGTINVPDIKKLHRVVDTLNTEDLVLNVNSNNLEYKGSDVKFKYHLFEEGFLSKPNLNIEKIKGFSFDVNFEMTREVVQSLLKGSTFASETNKVYLYTEDSVLKADLTDKARHNTDNYSIKVADADFDLKPIPINFDNIRLMSNNNNTYNCNINTEFGVVVIDNDTDGIKLKYIISSLTQ